MERLRPPGAVAHQGPEPRQHGAGLTDPLTTRRFWNFPRPLSTCPVDAL
jgi:hypothetical protein